MPSTSELAQDSTFQKHFCACPPGVLDMLSRCHHFQETHEIELQSGEDLTQGPREVLLGRRGHGNPALDALSPVAFPSTHSTVLPLDKWRPGRGWPPGGAPI